MSFTTDELTFDVTFDIPIAAMALLNIQCQSDIVMKSDDLKHKSTNKSWHGSLLTLSMLRFLKHILLLYVPEYSWQGFEEITFQEIF